MDLSPRHPHSIARPSSQGRENSSVQQCHRPNRANQVSWFALFVLKLVPLVGYVPHPPLMFTCLSSPSEQYGLCRSLAGDVTFILAANQNPRRYIPMQTLREVLKHAQQVGKAVGHFNISDLTLLKAVVEAARELSVPVLVGASEGERSFMG